MGVIKPRRGSISCYPIHGSSLLIHRHLEQATSAALVASFTFSLQRCPPCYRPTRGTGLQTLCILPQWVDNWLSSHCAGTLPATQHIWPFSSHWPHQCSPPKGQWAPGEQSAWRLLRWGPNLAYCQSCCGDIFWELQLFPKINSKLWLGGFSLSQTEPMVLFTGRLRLHWSIPLKTCL